MEQYKIKNEYSGLIITKNVYGLGQVTFDSSKVDPKDYKTYVKLGFEELFEKVVEEVIEFIVDEIKEVIEEVKEKRAKKKSEKKNLLDLAKEQVEDYKSED